MNLYKDAKLIGKGAQAEIYHYKNYAYKVFRKDYL